MKRIHIYSAFITLLLPALVHAEITRTLKAGDRGLDVKELQVFLNSDPDTRIATVGAGSPGNESTYFGALTTLAVKRFQTKYAYETLTPAGLSSPTGIVGYYTRLRIAKIIQTRTLTTPGTTVLPSNSTSVVVTSVNPSVITTYPATITIRGSGFATSNNTLMLSGETDAGISGIASLDGKTITISFAYPPVAKAREQLARYQGMSNYPAIKAAYLANISDVSVTAIPVVLVIKNQYGESAPYTFYVNLASML